VLRTERLVLRPLDPDVDAESLHAGYLDDESIRWWHEPAPRDLDETRQRVAARATRGAELAICIDAADSPAVGHTGWLSTGAGRRHGFGYFLRREHWGRGIALEASQAALRHGFEQLGAAGAELWVYEGNTRSAALAERLGCTLRGRFVAFNLARGAAFDTLAYGIEGPTPQPARVVGLVPSLEVADVGASQRFWVEHLGFEVEWAVGDPPTLVSLARRDWTPPGATVRFAAGSPPAAAPLAGKLDVLVVDIDHLDRELRERRTPIAVALATQPWGLRELTVVDPNGVTVRFYSPVV